MRLIALLLLLSSLGFARVAAAGPPLNIVIIYADDLGYGDPTCYNHDSKIPTPNIDKLAAQGMRFTDAHSSSGVCSPSRYSLLTGRYHWRTRLQRGIVGLWGPPLIAPDRLTIAGLVKKQGYQTACTGKWHLGWDWPIEAGERKFFNSAAKNATANDAHRAAWKSVFSKTISGGPTTRGFDQYFGTDVPNWPPFCFIDNDRTVGIPSEYLPANLFQNNLASQQGPALDGWDLKQILPTVVDHAIAYIRAAAAKEEPYLLYLPLTSPHTPLAVLDAFKGKSGLNSAYADLVMETDAMVGRVLEAIDQTGEADRTLVFFTSDNGCAPYIGVADLEKQGHYPSGPLRGYKSDAWEGGHRIPFIVRWPGVVKPGTTSDQLVQQADILATCAEATGAKVPDNAGEDSFSIVPLLKGVDKPVREHAVNQSSNGLLALRQGSWKLIFGPGSGGWSKGRVDEAAQLYNLADDLGEKNNLYAKEPQRVKAMTQLMAELIERGRSTPGPKQANDEPVRWQAPK